MDGNCRVHFPVCSDDSLKESAGSGRRMKWGIFFDIIAMQTQKAPCEILLLKQERMSIQQSAQGAWDNEVPRR
jgi:hypothetical protein